MPDQPTSTRKHQTDIRCTPDCAEKNAVFAIARGSLPSVLAGLLSAPAHRPVILCAKRPALALSVAAILIAPCGVLAKGQPRELMNQMQMAISACQEADKQLWKNAEAVATAMEEIWQRRKRLPESDSALDEYVRSCKLQPLHFTNPYALNELLLKEINEKFGKATDASGRHDCKLSVVVDRSLNSVQVRAYQLYVPPAWIKAPGTINVIHNDRAEFLIWAAGIDGRPLKESGTGKIQVIYRALQ